MHLQVQRIIHLKMGRMFCPYLLPSPFLKTNSLMGFWFHHLMKHHALVDINLTCTAKGPLTNLLNILSPSYENMNIFIEVVDLLPNSTTKS